MGKKKRSYAKTPYNSYKYKKQNKLVGRESRVINKIGDSFLNLHFIANGTSQWKFYSDFKSKRNMAKYIAHRQKQIPLEILTKHQNKKIDSHNSFLNYMNNPRKQHDDHLDPDKIWHYSNLYHIKNKGDISSKKTTSRRSRWELTNAENLRKVHEHSHIWSIVISEKDLKMMDILYENQHKIADRVLRSLFDFPVDAVVAFHGNTPHPHIHIMAYQPVVMKLAHIEPKFFLDERNLKNARKSYANFLIDNKTFFNKILQEKADLRDSFQGEVLIRHFKDELWALRKILKNSFEFNRLNPLQKIKVEEFKKKMLELPTVDPELMKFQDDFKRFNEECDKMLVTEIASLEPILREGLSDQLNDFRNEVEEKLNQQILKTLKKFCTEDNIKLFEYLDKQFPKIEKQELLPRQNKMVVKVSGPSIVDLFKSCDNITNTYFPALKKLLREQQLRKRRYVNTEQNFRKK